jgi:predicted ATPase with chaperone activity
MESFPVSPQPASQDSKFHPSDFTSAADGVPLVTKCQRDDDEAASRPFFPREPRSLSETGLAERDIDALILKLLLNNGVATGRRINEQIKLPYKLVDQRLGKLKSDLLVSHRSAVSMGDYKYQLTDIGLQRAREYSNRCTYFGAAPVSLTEYVASVLQQDFTIGAVELSTLREAFADLFLSATTLSQLGQAINSRRGLFLYGAPGNGKSSIADRIGRVFSDHIWIPRTITVTGEMIRLYDPSCHQIVPLDQAAGGADDSAVNSRWVPIRRPTIIVGGELTLEKLDVYFNLSTGINEAPVQLKSNCGTLVVDDFGRQRGNRSELLNRWIVPLEQRHDYLNLPSGRQIKVPFQQLLVLATNLDPNQFVDEALMRRIPYKLEVAGPTEDEFRKLIRRTAEEMQIQLPDGAVDHLLERHYKTAKRPLRFCHPRELLLQVRQFCQLHDAPVELTPQTIDQAAVNYFGGI